MRSLSGQLVLQLPHPACRIGLVRFFKFYSFSASIAIAYIILSDAWESYAHSMRGSYSHLGDLFSLGGPQMVVTVFYSGGLQYKFRFGPPGMVHACSKIIIERSWTI